MWAELSFSLSNGSPEWQSWTRQTYWYCPCTALWANHCAVSGAGRLDKQSVAGGEAAAAAAHNRWPVRGVSSKLSTLPSILIQVSVTIMQNWKLSFQNKSQKHKFNAPSCKTYNWCVLMFYKERVLTFTDHWFCRKYSVLVFPILFQISSPGNYLLIHIVLKVIVSRILRFYINDNGNIQWLNFDSKFLKKT